MDQPAYFQSHPPRCIAAFVAEPASLPGVQFDGHASLSQLVASVPQRIEIHAPEHSNPIFALSCKCGSRRHFVHGYRWRNPDYDNVEIFVSPLALQCAACKSMTDLFDTDIHGYEGEVCRGSAAGRAEGEQHVFECPTCGRQPSEAFVRFEFSDDLFGGDFPEFAGREQDLFSWFTLVVRCGKCKQLLTVADFECA